MSTQKMGREIEDDDVENIEKASGFDNENLIVDTTYTVCIELFYSLLDESHLSRNVTGSVYNKTRR